jgi:signal transduction histidine kinase
LESNTRLTLMGWHLFEAAGAYLFQDAETALENIRKCETYLASASCMATIPLHHLYHALSLLACYPGMEGKQRRAALAKVSALQKKMKLWARHAPMNYQHKWQLVEAEHKRVLGKPKQAAILFDLAIDAARESGYVNDEALCNELAARSCIEAGNEKPARAYLREAHAKYQQWGAVAKVAQLEKKYSDLLSGVILQRQSEVQPQIQSGERQLDIDTVIKASQTLSGEIQLDKLLEKLMLLLIENAGAQKGALLLQKDGVLMLQAQIEADAIKVLQNLPASECADVSLGIINYVKRTREKVVLGDAGADSRFDGDPYIERAHPKSVLCIPLQKQSELVGILYLENNLAVDAFTPKRSELLQILSTQIAISLENASLYNELEQKIAVRTQALSQKNVELSETLSSLKQTQQQLVESAKLASLGQLVAGVAHEINTPVGIGVTAASTLAEETDKIGALYQTGAMKRSDLDNYMAVAATISKLLLSNMDRAATMIQSFKEVAIDQTSEERRTFRLHQYIDEVLLNLSPMMKKHGHAVTVECADGIEIDSYPGALSQVLTNLVMNALLHAFADGIAGMMSIRVGEPDAGSIELRFSDNGKGIPAENLSKIFDPFFTTMRGRGGSGLGLNIIHTLVTGSLQGQIAVESAVNVGTTFILRFPRSVVKVSAGMVAGHS